MAIKTNERPGTRAVLRHSRMSSTKAREVLNLIRGLEYTRAAEIVAHTDRAAATVIGKLLRSCAANAEHNEGLDPAELFVASCYADEGATLKRWRPRARGRATRIRKRSCHITVILARMPEDRLQRQRARTAADLATRRARRVAGTRRRDAELEETRSGASDEASDATTAFDEKLANEDALVTDEEVETEDGAVEDSADDGAVDAEDVEDNEVEDGAVDDGEVETDDVEDDAAGEKED